MSIIITARFQEQTQADAAVNALQAEGFLLDKISTFYVGSPGQHDLYPIGGDEMESPGMEGATSAGAVAATVGGSVGLISGLATLPILGPAAVVAGTGIGAWVGSLYGALEGSKDPGQADGGNVTAERPGPARKSGMLVAVEAASVESQTLAAKVLHRLSGMDVGKADGRIIASNWDDFDPIAPVIPLHRDSTPE
jgi:hypothetical protein